jgi:hypothetical protein
VTRRPKRKEPLHWNEVKSDSGELLGTYAIDGTIIIVRSAKGWEKQTGKSGANDNDGLARLILSEGPPT